MKNTLPLSGFLERLSVHRNVFFLLTPQLVGRAAAVGELSRAFRVDLWFGSGRRGRLDDGQHARAHESR